MTTEETLTETLGENIVAPKSREEHMVNYINAVQTTENEMALFREHLKDLKVSYIENEYLTKDDIALVTKAYKILKGKMALDDIVDAADVVKNIVEQD